MKKTIHIILVGIGLLCFVFFLSGKRDKASSLQLNPRSNVSVSTPLAQQNETQSQKKIKEINQNTNKEMGPYRNGGADKAFQLTRGSFEGYVSRCFDGENCVLDEDPWTMYQMFKAQGKMLAVDNLISFMRREMREPRTKAQYKNVLKKMIVDFYPPEERQFQEAAYYNYVGNPNKSLALYLDLEEKARLDPTLRPAPQLNIANTFYDLGRFNEALPYYENALSDYRLGRQKSGAPSQAEMIAFIENRVFEIKSKR